MEREENTKAIIRIYSALGAMDKNIQRVQAIADGCPISLSSNERGHDGKGTPTRSR
jgi:hypothetical protein